MLNKTFQTIVIILAIVCLRSSNVAAQQSFQDLIPRWELAMDSLKIPGMVIAVVDSEGVIFMQEFGYRNIDKELPVTFETIFYIASMTKPFVAMATTQLAHQDSIVLNRPVRTYLPQFRLADYTETITITVRDLLAHRRGLQDYAITFGEAFSGQMNEERYYRLLRRVKAVGELDYTNLHYTLLGRIIESVTGDTWKEYIERKVLQPAGMNRSTTSVAPLKQDPNAAVPYEYIYGDYKNTRLKTDRTMHAAGGMLSTAEDLSRWIRIHLNEGQLDGKTVFPKTVIKEMLKPQIFEDDPHPLIPNIHKRIGWGLGWDIHEHRKARLYIHGGAYTGWASHMSFMPETNVGVVVLINTRGPSVMYKDIVAMDIYDRKLGFEHKDYVPQLSSMFKEQLTMKAPAKVLKDKDAGPSLPLDRYTGTYLNEDWGTLEVWLKENELKARIGDLDLPLDWVGVDSLLIDGDQDGKFEIIQNKWVMAILISELEAEGLVRFVHQ